MTSRKPPDSDEAGFPADRLSREARRHGYHELPISFQSPTARRPVNKSSWVTCERCRRLTPADHAGEKADDAAWETGELSFYVCAFCGHVHVGRQPDSDDIRAQKRCHECGTELSDAYQCPRCLFPRGWKSVHCPYCENQQPVFMPHWVVLCDVFHLECVACESQFDSLCIC